LPILIQVSIEFRSYTCVWPRPAGLGWQHRLGLPVGFGWLAWL